MVDPEVMGLQVAQQYRVQIRYESRTSPLPQSKGTTFSTYGKLGVLSSGVTDVITLIG